MINRPAEPENVGETSVEQAPDPRGATCVGDLIETLRVTKAVRGAPSVRDLTARVNRERAARQPRSGRETVGPRPVPVTRSTVGYLLQPGRARLDHDLLFDVLAALGLDHGDLTRWREAWRAVTTRGPAGSTPRASLDLPEPPGELIGRGEVVGRVLDGLAPGRSLVVEGMPGVGRTHLLLTCGRLWSADQPPGALTLHLGPAPDPAATTADDALDALITALGASWSQLPRTTAQKSRVLGNLTRGHPALVVVDLPEVPPGLLEALEAAQSWAVLVAGRRRLRGETVGDQDSTSVRLGPLTPDAATRLLARDAGPELVAADPVAAARIVGLCGRLPLAVRAAGRLIAATPAWTLADHAARLEQSGPPGLQAALGASYTALSPAGRHLLQIITQHPGPSVSQDVLARVSGISGTGADLDELVDACLVTADQDGRLHLALPVRAFVGHRVVEEVSPHEQDDVVRRLAAVHLEDLTRAVTTLHPPAPATATADVSPGDTSSARAWLDAERDTLIAVIALTERRRLDQAAVDLTQAWWPHLVAVRDVGASLPAQEAATHASRRIGRPDVEGRALHREAVTWLWAGHRDRAADAMFAALRRARTAGDDDLEGTAENGLGILAQMNGDPDEAVEHYERAVAVHTRLGRTVGVAKALGNLGAAYESLGRVEESVTTYRQSLELNTTLGNRPGQAATHHNLGTAFRTLGRWTEAAAALRRSITLDVELGNRHNEAVSTAALAVVEASLGRAATTESLLLQAAELARSLESRDLDACLLNEKALALTALGRLTQAAAAFTEALGVAERAGNSEEEQRATRGLRGCAPP